MPRSSQASHLQITHGLRSAGFAIGGGPNSHTGAQRPAPSRQDDDDLARPAAAHQGRQAAGLVVGLEKYSTPKLLALDTALVSATAGSTFAEARADAQHWGQLVETAVGSHLIACRDPRAEVLHWRDRDKEVDFVVQRGKQLTAVEVKSGRRRDGLPGMAAFEAAYGLARKLLVGGDGTPVEAFLADPAPALAG
jgi:Domain of unknown function (DUF4143)